VRRPVYVEGGTRTERRVEGVFFRHPIQYVRANGWAGLLKDEVLDFNPFMRPVSADRLVVGSNPLISSLVAMHYAQRGERVLLSVPWVKDDWAYEVIFSELAAKIISDVLGVPHKIPRRALFDRVFSRCASALHDTNSVVIDSRYMPTGLFSDFDGVYCGYINERPSWLVDPDGAQASLLVSFKHSVQKGVGCVNGSGGSSSCAFLVEKVTMTSHDRGLLIPCQSSEDSALQIVSQHSSDVDRFASALGYVGGGDAWVRRVLADLIAVRALMLDRPVDDVTKHYFP
jgi:hypothetical protein